MEVVSWLSKEKEGKRRSVLYCTFRYTQTGTPTFAVSISLCPPSRHCGLTFFQRQRSIMLIPKKVRQAILTYLFKGT